MNWTEIRDKYPKAFKLSLEYTLRNNFDLHTNRWHYDFFDENGINVIINKENNYWSFDIYLICGKSGFTSRKEAEAEAFIKAFSILEDKLKNK